MELTGAAHTALIARLKREEGLRLFPYKDTVGVNTIGYGRNLDYVGISKVEAEIMLDNDVENVVVELKKTFTFFKDLDDARKVVFADMAYNMGIHGLSQFRRMIAAVAKGDYKLAAKEMLNSEWAKQVKNRANDLAYLMETGKL